MNRTIHIGSSNIAAYGYDGTDMEVQFHDGDVYVYRNVTQFEYAQFRSAESKGSHLQREISRSHRYSVVPNPTCWHGNQPMTCAQCRASISMVMRSVAPQMISGVTGAITRELMAFRGPIPSQE